jgi:hypothetical protein
MGQDGRRHPREQAPEGLGPMPGQPQALGQLPGRRLDPIPQHRHRPPHGGGQPLALGPAGRQDDLGAPRSLGGHPGSTGEAAVEQQPSRARALQQGIGDRPLVHRRWNDAPGPHQPRAQVGPQRQTEAREPLAVGRVAPEAGVQVARPMPVVWPPHPAGVLDRQGRGVHLLPGVFGKLADHVPAEILERPPEPADPGCPLGRNSLWTGRWGK